MAEPNKATRRLLELARNKGYAKLRIYEGRNLRDYTRIELYYKLPGMLMSSNVKCLSRKPGEVGMDVYITNIDYTPGEYDLERSTE